MWMMQVKKADKPEQNSWSEEIVRKDPDTHEWKPIRKNSSKETALKYANELVKYFNDTRRPEHNESAREVVGVFKK